MAQEASVRVFRQASDDAREMAMRVSGSVDLLLDIVINELLLPGYS